MSETFNFWAWCTINSDENASEILLELQPQFPGVTMDPEHDYVLRVPSECLKTPEQRMVLQEAFARRGLKPIGNSLFAGIVATRLHAAIFTQR
jgi:hypothetical protein